MCAQNIFDRRSYWVKDTDQKISARSLTCWQFVADHNPYMSQWCHCCHCLSYVL